MILINDSEIKIISGGALEDFDYQPDQIHGSIGGGYGQDVYGNHYGEIHGNIEINQNIEIHASATTSDLGDKYYIGGDWKF